MDRPFPAGDLPAPVQTLRQILRASARHLTAAAWARFPTSRIPPARAWLQRRIEESQNATNFTPEERLRILQKLSASELFERFLHTKFLGQKRFSLEGAESLIPGLDSVVEDAPSHHIRELVLGMAHRGRLNVLSNIVGKGHSSRFSELENSRCSSPFARRLKSQGLPATAAPLRRKTCPVLTRLLAHRGGGHGGGRRARAKQTRVGDTRADDLPV